VIWPGAGGSGCGRFDSPLVLQKRGGLTTNNKFCPPGIVMSLVRQGAQSPARRPADKAPEGWSSQRRDASSVVPVPRKASWTAAAPCRFSISPHPGI